MYECYNPICPGYDQGAFCIECAGSGNHTCFPLRPAGKALSYYDQRWNELKEGTEQLNAEWKLKG